ncbi:MAG TPA: Holliday junction resolvase RuvX [Nevskiaceae bacterium]|nr:Holliday junction resolvase RuvX [Nevskiaceae bacterium]
MTASAQNNRHSIYLAFDYGARRIGVAVGDDLTKSARPLATIANAQTPDWTAIEREIKAWKPSACIVGLPLDLDGNEQAISQQARAFAKALGDRYAIPVHLSDERFSSRSAMDELRSARASGRMTRRVRSGDRDQQAARLILEQWLAGPHP